MAISYCYPLTLAIWKVLSLTLAIQIKMTNSKAQIENEAQSLNDK